MQNIILRKAILTAMVAALLCGAAQCQTLQRAESQPAFRMAGIFTDHMVLQRDQPLPVWGWAAPGRTVTVEVGPHSARTRTNAEGRWRVTLPSLESGKGPLTMTVKAGDETIRLTDILVGEVWLCSGQSNMEMTVAQSADGKAEIKAANHPNIRLFNIPRPTAMASDPQDDVDGQWQACSPETIGDFSAVGYYFGREIHQSIEVPVGLINASWGGTIIETWTRHEEISRLPGMTQRIAEAQDIHRDPTVVPTDMTAKEKRAAEIHLADFKAKAKYKLAFKASQERAAKSRQAFNEARANDELAREMSSPDLDLRSWKTMEIPNQWGKEGLPNFRGMVWFRKTIDVPESWAGKKLVLHLDRILEGDVTWFNGEQVGATPVHLYHKPRVYSIPANLVKAGANTITVRVVDTYRSRGMTGNADVMALCVAGSEKTDRIGLAGPWRYKPEAHLFKSLPYPDDQVNHPTLLYNTMIHPLVPFGIRGIAWYQGEQNLGDGILYFDKMQALIQSWRNVFLRPDAPFYFVQIAPYRYGGGNEQALAELWEAQTAAMDIPHTGMAVISDVGHVQNLHPSNKQDVGKRLALWALAKDYGQEDLVHSGPLYKSMAIEGNKIRLSFDHTGSGLASRDDKPLDWFEIAGKDGKFVKAQATIDGDTVLVFSDEIAKPTAARFAWHQEGVPNLMNKEGLPAGPLRTHRPKKSEPKKSKPKKAEPEKDLGKIDGKTRTAIAQAPANDFDKTIAPLLADKCMSCHSGADPKGALDLSSQAMAMKGGESGAAIVANDLDESLLWERVASDEMPPKKPLTDEEKSVLKEWIAAGATWGSEEINPARFTTANRAGLDWWSLQPLEEAAVPEASSEAAHTDWRSNPIDRFVLAKLKENGLTPSPRAGARARVRRLYYDLLGLPPDADELKKFEADPSDAAYLSLVDRLLQSPHYGERWGRHWLDVARFGESDGFERNDPRRNAWHYRDWVIEALNNDMPYDEFVRMQLAGDILRPGQEGAAAVGFLVAGVHNTVVGGSQRMKLLARQDELEEVIAAVGQTFLGLTVNCARCHDHKFDPIPATDYYSMISAIDGVAHGEREVAGEDVSGEFLRIDAQLKTLEDALGKIDEQARTAILKARKSASAGGENLYISEETIVQSLPEEVRSRRAALKESLGEAERQLRTLLQQRSKMYTVAARTPGVMRVHVRGDVEKYGDEVAPRGVSAIEGSNFGLEKNAPDRLRRKKLAQWVTSKSNPLFSRVIVNRVWHYHFGLGIVETPNDLGFNGGRPSNQALLDWLAWDFQENGYQLKRLHRLIVSSAAYQQSSKRSADAFAKDAENRLIWRYSPRRVEAEVLRDSILKVAGVLNPQLGGPGFEDVRSNNSNNGTTYYDPVDREGEAFNRRTVYRFSPRGGRSALLDTFDCPDPSMAAPRRSVTTTPLQALSLLNNSFVLRMADQLAKRVADESENDTAQQVKRAWQIALNREPTRDEAKLAEELVAKHGLPTLCRALFNTNEFIVID